MEWAGATTGADGRAYILGITELLVFSGTSLISRTAAPVGRGVVSASVTNNGVAVGKSLVCFYSFTPNGVVCYDIKTHLWKPVVTCSSPHVAGAIVAVNSTVFVAGGYAPNDGNSPIDVVEIFTFTAV